jgi:hypothetical protein
MRFSLEDRSPSVEFEDLVQVAFRAISKVPDFRKARGRRFDLGGLLALVVGLASGHHSFAAIAAFGKRREDDPIPMLGLPRAPSRKTVWRIARGVSPGAVRLVLREVGAEATAGLFETTVAVDGKCMRGSRTKSGERPDVVIALEHPTGIVLDTLDVPPGSPEKIAARRMMRQLAKSPRIATSRASGRRSGRGGASRGIRPGRSPARRRTRC